MAGPGIFKKFFDSEKSGGFVLIAAAIFSILLANTGFGESLLDFIHQEVDLSFANVHLNYSIEHWVNDGLMAIFFLLVGLEIERQLIFGELSSFKNAILPVIAAVGGMVVPATIYMIFNAGTEAQPGFGIPMATDIAFALGVLSLAGNRVPVSLKIFLTALAIIDDLGAILVIAIFYSSNISFTYLLIALGIFLFLFFLGKFKVHALIIYLVGGVLMWYCMLQSGVHSTIAGVLLAFAIPSHRDDQKNISYKLQRALHFPVAFIILPIFAFVNTIIILPEDIQAAITRKSSIGIIAGLVIGKLIGILLTCYIAVKLKFAALPAGATWGLVAGVALLGGIGFTMSIFITNLAFTETALVVDSKISILIASVIAAIGGLLILLNSDRVKISRKAAK